MLTDICPERAEAPGHTAPSARRTTRSLPAAGPKRGLAANEFLFRDGEARGDVYRVERGAVCHYIVWEDGHHEIIEFAFPGDLIGFGHLEARISSAQAVVETEVSVVLAQDFADLIEADAQLAARVAAADDREFEYARARSVRTGEGRPVERVASFLTALSHLSRPEGRDPTLITDEIASEAVAERLHMSRDCVVGVLSELEERGLIRASAAGVRIVDMGGLERLADAA
jgi:CRP/FNR family transcriptional regulator